MLKDGLVEEVKGLQQEGCHRGMVSMQGLGYKKSWLTWRANMTSNAQFI